MGKDASGGSWKLIGGPVVSLSRKRTKVSAAVVLRATPLIAGRLRLGDARRDPHEDGMVRVSCLRAEIVV